MRKQHRDHEIVGKAELAKVIGRTTRTLDRWVIAGLPRREDGRFDLAKVRRWMEKSGRLSSGRLRADAAYLAARGRRMSAQAALREMEVQTLTGGLVPIKKVEREYGALIRQLRDAFLHIFDQADAALAVNTPLPIVREKLKEDAQRFLQSHAKELGGNV